MSTTFASIQIRLANDQFIEFSSHEIVNASVVEECNSLAIELPISTLDFHVRDLTGSMSMFDGTLFAQLVERLPVTCYEYYEGDYHLIGKFYLDSWKNLGANEVQFTAMDIIGLLAESEFDGIFWATSVTLPVALTAIFAGFNITYDVHASLLAVEVSGWLPPGKYRDALQQLCFAAGAMIVTARTERMQVVPADFPVIYYDQRIDETTARQNTIELLPMISTIELVSHNYTVSLETKVIFDKTLEAGEHKVVFDAPYYNIVIDGLGYVPKVLGTEDGGDYVGTTYSDYIEAGGTFQFGSNSVLFSLTAPSAIVITGTPWIDSKRSFLFTESGVQPTQNKKSLSITNATLVNFDRAQVILDRLRDYYRQRYIQDLTLFPCLLKSSDTVLSNTFEQRKILSTIVKSEIGLSSGFLQKILLRGFLPPYILESVTPVRRWRTGISVTSSNLTINNRWRHYD